MYEIDGGKLDNQPYEVIDGIVINTKNYNRLCRYVEKHVNDKFDKFAYILIEKLKVFYEMFKDISNLGVLKEACFNISDYKIFNDNKKTFETESKKSALAYIISQYNNSDIKNGNDHIKYFENVLVHKIKTSKK